MKAIDKMIKLADLFEYKLSKAQAIIEENPKAVTSDAFFNPRGPKDEQEFQKFILDPGNNFLKALPETVKKCAIGASVNAKNKSAQFIVTCTPPASSAVTQALVNALVADYTKYYGKSPTERLTFRMIDGTVNPGLETSAPEIITIT